MIFSLDFGVHTPKYGTQLRRKIPRTSTSNGTNLTLPYCSINSPVTMPEKDEPEHIPNVPIAPMFAENVGGTNLAGYVHIIISACVSEPFCSICGGLCGCLFLRVPINWSLIDKM